MGGKYRPVQCLEETYEKKKFIAKVLGKSLIQSDRELTDAFFQIAAMFPSGLEVDYEVSVLNNTLTIRFHGKSCMIIGTSEEELMATMTKMQKQAQEDVKKAHKKVDKI